MLQISKSYTFKQLCHKSDTTLRKYLTQQNFSHINEEQSKLDIELNETDNNEYIIETSSDNLSFDTQELTLVTENLTLFQCDKCNDSFELKVDLEVHKIEHDNEIRESEKSSYEAVDKYTCNICKKQFKGTDKYGCLKIFQYNQINIWLY